VDQTLLERTLQSGRPEARALVIRHYLPLAHRLAARYRASAESQEDLQQVASLGLVKALDGYDVAKGPFVRYAVPTILGELRRHFRNTGWAMHVPRSLQERVLKVSEARDRLATRSGGQPTPTEIAAATALSVDDVVEALDAGRAYVLTPLDARLPAADGDGDSLGETIGVHDEAYAAVERREALRPLLTALPDREKTILKLRFFDELTQSQIAERVGCSQMHVSRLLRRTLAQLSEDSESGSGFAA
jgi:RNA polymerase sigma-B factor